jgi:nucleotide-binding universal stress UspA family protein
MFKKILVPLDGSKFSEAVLPYVRSLAQAHQAEVYVLQVTEPLRPSLYPQGVALLEPVVRELRAEANAYIHKMATTLNDQDIRAHGEVVDAVGIANAILGFAESKGVDLIALSTHGRSGVGRWLLGSTADKVIHGASVPVLLVRPDLSEGGAA